MIEEQKMMVIEIAALVAKVKEFHAAGYRLVQICATKTDVYELDYSFDKDYQFTDLRIILPTVTTVVPSVSQIYWSAFLYENEIHDLFGVIFDGIALDYQGKFYRTTVKYPFGEQK